MAIKDTTRKPYIEDNDTSIKIGIDLPIRRGTEADGFFATSSTTIEAVKNNIRNLLNTHQGERLMQPNLGINLRQFLFENITDDNILMIQNAILDKLEIWLPFVEVRDIQIITQENDNLEQIIIEGFTYKYLYPSFYNVAISSSDSYGYINVNNTVVDATSLVKLQQTLLNLIIILVLYMVE